MLAACAPGHLGGSTGGVAASDTGAVPTPTAAPVGFCDGKAVGTLDEGFASGIVTLDDGIQFDIPPLVIDPDGRPIVGYVQNTFFKLKRYNLDGGLRDVFSGDFGHGASTDFLSVGIDANRRLTALFAVRNPSSFVYERFLDSTVADPTVPTGSFAINEQTQTSVTTPAGTTIVVTLSNSGRLRLYSLTPGGPPTPLTATTDFEEIVAAALAPNGQLVIAGTERTAGRTSVKFAIVNPTTGVLINDPTFRPGNPGNGINFTVTAMSIDSNNHVVLGIATDAPGSYNAVVRFNNIIAQGPDPSFSPNGMRQIPEPVSSVATDAGGRVYYYSGASGSSRNYVRRLKADGTDDSTFHGPDLVAASTPTLALTPDGKRLYLSTRDSYRLFLRRFCL